jgi:hypothetical protein
MVWPYSDKHPISFLLYGLGLAGLALLAYRRKPQDKFLLVWFITIYVIFTIIPNRQWRYVTPLFPVLAISASVIVASIIGRAQRAWQSTKSSLTKVRLAKFTGALLIIFVAAGVFYSSMDAITWAGKDQPQVPVQEAATYAMSKTQSNQSILVLCPHNLFSKDMVSFYLNCKSANKTPVYQYPELAVDAYTPEFNVTELVNFCQTKATKIVMLYEYGGTISYYNSNLTEQAVFVMLNEAGRFNLTKTFGTAPNRIFVLSFK